MTEVLAASGIRCEVAVVDVPESAAALLAPVLREASTNVLPRSRARWCRIEVARHGDGFAMTVTNDGALSSGPDAYGYGLRGRRATRVR